MRDFQSAIYLLARRSPLYINQALSAGSAQEHVNSPFTMKGNSMTGDSIHFLLSGLHFRRHSHFPVYP